MTKYCIHKAFIWTLYMPYVLREQIFQKIWKNINKPKKILARNISNLVKLSLRQSQRRREKMKTLKQANVL